MQLLVGGILGFALGSMALRDESWAKVIKECREKYQQHSKHALWKQPLVESPISIVTYPNFRIVYSKVAIETHRVSGYHQLWSKPSQERISKETRREEPQIEDMFRAKESHFKKTQAYKKLYLSRGHMAAAGNYNSNKLAKDNTFTYANIIPQNSDNNEDTWLTFQTYQRLLAQKCESVNIISGPVFRPTRPQDERESEHPILRIQYNILDWNGPAVPTHLYKIIRCNEANGSSHASAFLFKNKYSYDNNKTLSDFEISLDSLERETGLLFQFDENSLIQFDKETLGMTKEEFNKEILYPKIYGAKKYDEIESEIRKLKSHKVKQDDEVSRKIEELVEAKFQQSYSNQCEGVLKTIQLGETLRKYKYLNERVDAMVDKEINQHLSECTDRSYLEKIRTKLYYAEKRNPKYSQKLLELDQILADQAKPEA